ncbi:hypothetical protein ACR79T_05880 [Sphingobacterium spiritivorum]|uniref:hypothetical protein n=1 Tax=Sphingobacterium spiritivorum TaxID=258 RepID=UPI003DA4F400
MTWSASTKIEDPVTATNPDEQEVILPLMIPQNNRPGTYAIDTVDQNMIHILDVMAFHIKDYGKEIYASCKTGVLQYPEPGATEVNFNLRSGLSRG